MSIFNGVATALITPFRDDKVDFNSLEKLVKFQLDGGIDALVINGTTGEPTTMTHAERTAVASFVIKQVDKKVPIILGAGSNNTYTAVEYAMEAEQLGADGILAVTPYYNKCTQKGIIAHYASLSKAVSLPIIAYNVPSRTGVNIDPNTVLELAAYDNVVAIKEASGSIHQFMEVARLVAGKMDIYSGDDAYVYSLMTLGAKGVISVASNIIPDYMVKMTTAFNNGDWQTAREMQFKVCPLVKALFAEVNPIPVKCAARIMGLCDDYMRLPLLKHSMEDNLLKEMRAFGLKV